MSAGDDFIRAVVRADLAAGRHDEVVTRFPPEPNGYLHIGHAKSICLNFGVPQEFGGRCHMRFDDTNPTKEEHEFIEAIMEDVRWLGFDWGSHLYFASDHFERLYEWAEHLIQSGDAYVDDLSAEEIRAHRGTLTEAGRDSPYRTRPAAESLDLFRRMRAGEFSEGARVLRAKIDMAAGNINMRDPVLYRILHAAHPRTGDEWCIYPTYDFAHGQSDAIEGVTHSLCTLEFEDHRPLYDWLIEHLPVPMVPRQYEFSRLNLSHTVLSKRRLTQMVEEGRVDGWDDPRMPTLRGLRRRGVPPEAIRNFVGLLAISKTSDNLVEQAMLDHAVRERLNKSAPRRFGVLHPLKLTIENYPDGEGEWVDALNNPEDPDAGTRQVRFSRTLYVEADDFMEDPPRKFFRLAPGREARLRYGYLVTCREAVKDSSGAVTELRCTYDPETRGGQAPDGRKVRGRAALGLGAGLGRGGGAALRLPLHRAAAGYGRRHAVGRPQPGIAHRADRLPARAGSRQRGAGGNGAVRAAGLFLPGSGFHARRARLQPHGRPARFLGTGTEAGSEPGLSCRLRQG